MAYKRWSEPQTYHFGHIKSSLERKDAQWATHRNALLRLHSSQFANEIDLKQPGRSLNPSNSHGRNWKYKASNFTAVHRFWCPLQRPVATATWCNMQLGYLLWLVKPQSIDQFGRIIPQRNVMYKISETLKPPTSRGIDSGCILHGSSSI